ncbi:regulatory protein ArsR [Caldicellulosiruptor owensensis OL]|uniref:Regulatory protein ArsR n=1 Tax=Caldicellulosiruptor owensensis (strain ATCC 700167 / DSM 13100 / OL) TaxID=632518 RepID=E4Q5C0_CALOW|nr:metalloregulator ArsR/SmtB family transcription factor [Caldicellulosiruptor owensensis]ADQ05404.1 regulatory protein ArsR [Caldicellulosiruptor owensensis OL]
MTRLNEILYALSDTTRLRILNILAHREQNVSSLVHLIQESQPKVSRHLAYLKNVGLIEARNHAQKRIYSIKEDVFEKYPFLKALIQDLAKVDIFANDLRLLSSLS